MLSSVAVAVVVVVAAAVLATSGAKAAIEKVGAENLRAITLDNAGHCAVAASGDCRIVQ